MFLTILSKRIVEINNIINKSKLVKPKINMTTKGLSKNRSMSESNIIIIKSNTDFIKSPHLLQSKLYLKILCLSYYVKHTNNLIISELVEKVIKKSHIFNNIILTSKS